MLPFRLFSAWILVIGSRFIAYQANLKTCRLTPLGCFPNSARYISNVNEISALTS